MRNSLKTLIGKENLIGAEIGVARGRNAGDILRNLDIKRIYLIDPYKRYTAVKHIGVPWDIISLRSQAYQTLSQYNDKIVWIYEMSDVAYKHIKEKLDFVYIDANHTYEYAKSDVKIYREIVKDGGLVAGHDYGGQVKQAVNELVPKDKLRVQDEDWWYTK